MENSYNVDSNLSQAPKTSSTDSKDNIKTTGDSQVQDGTGVEKHEEKAYEKSDEQQEYIEQANNNTEQGNTPPVKDGKGLTMMARSADEGDDDNDDGDPYTEIEVGDDSDETKKKIPVM